MIAHAQAILSDSDSASTHTQIEGNVKMHIS